LTRRKTYNAPLLMGPGVDMVTKLSGEDQHPRKAPANGKGGSSGESESMALASESERAVQIQSSIVIESQFL
jgi:hypothetical protein